MIINSGKTPLPGCGLEEILDSLPVSIYVKDKNLDYTWCNAPFGNLCSCEKSSLIGKDAKDYFDDSIAEMASEHDHKVLETGETAVFEASVNCCGHARNLRFIKLPARATDGTIAGVISVAFDRAAASPAEEELTNALSMLQAENAHLQKHAQDLETTLHYAEANAANIIEIAENATSERDRLTKHNVDLETSLAYTEEQASQLVELAEELEHQRQEITAHNVKIQDMMYRDDSTGVRNRRYFYQFAPDFLKQQAQNPNPLALAVLDLDFFKTINDKFGHLAGDKVLSNFTNLVQSCLPEDSIFCRLGGEEFVLLTPSMPESTIKEVMETVRSHVSQNSIKLGETEFKYTVSIGANLIYNKSKDLISLLQDADFAMYKAKENGRNQVFYHYMAD